jgi:UPF0755 protein
MRKLIFAVVALALIAAAAVGVWIFFEWQKLQQPYKGYEGESAEISVAPGTSAGAILRDLEDAGVLRDARAARLYLVYGLRDPALQAGEYRFTGPLNVEEVLRKITTGDVVDYQVTLVEGLNMWEVAQELSDEGFGDEERFLELMKSPDLIAHLDPEATSLEGYLFPDTYRFTRHADEQAVVRAMVDNFVSKFEAEVRPLLEERMEREAETGADPEATEGETEGADGDAEGENGTGAAKISIDPQDTEDETEDADQPAGSPAGPTLRELVTLASIVEKEARIPEERPVISGVYRNRLDRGIGLYADPTVIYALQLEGTWDGNIRRADLQVDNPYNTYRFPGLPPGPIASPGLASLKAAARPEEVPYLYFVSRNDGSHVFSETLREHNRNVDKWQRQYWRERRAEEREAERQGQ